MSQNVNQIARDTNLIKTPLLYSRCKCSFSRCSFSSTFSLVLSAAARRLLSFSSSMKFLANWVTFCSADVELPNDFNNYNERAHYMENSVTKKNLLKKLMETKLDEKKG